MKKAEGAVLFVDEAYRLNSESSNDFGKEALETIMARMLPHQNLSIKNPIIIFAGYKADMESFIRINDGLVRRIKTTLHFQDFLPSQLAEMTKRKLIEQGRRFPFNMDNLVVDCFSNISKHRISLNNAALCSDLIEAIQTCQEERLDIDCSLSDLDKFSTEDFEEGVKRFSKKITIPEKYFDASTQTEVINCNDVSTSMDFPEITLNIPGLDKPVIVSP